jgi:hypothetical protein
MRMMRSAALAAGLSLALTGAALAGGFGGGGNNDSGSGLNPNTQLTGNDRSAGVNSGSYDPYLRQRLDQQGWNGYGRNGYWTRPVRTAPPRLVPPFGGYPY